MSEAKRAFNEAILKSVGAQGDPDDISKYDIGIYCYPNSYAEAFKEHLDSAEYRPFSSRNSRPMFCALRSTARLTYLNLSKTKGIEFEKELPLDVPGNKNVRLAAAKKAFFETDAQEVVDGERDWIPVSYLEKLTSEFGIEEKDVQYKFVIKKRVGKKPLLMVGLYFDLHLLGIDLDQPYPCLHFNLKQLISDLIALANLEQKKKILRYVIYKPKKRYFRKSKELKLAYKELKKEIKAIYRKKDNHLFAFAKKHRIKLKKPKYVYVNKIKDPTFADKK